MKKLVYVLCVLSVMATIGFGIGWGMREYLYDVRIGQFIKLADDASTPAAKYDYLLKYRAEVVDHVKRDEARYVFRRQRLSKKVQLANLDSLIERLADIKAMPPDSLAYQQGMDQVSGQEFDHTLGEINGVFYDCYMRDSFLFRWAIIATFGLSVVVSICLMIASLYIYTQL